jgi:hypothetical protein
MPSIPTVPSTFTAFLKGITAKLLPTPVLDNIEQAPRMGRYGEIYGSIVNQNMQTLAEEGSYYVVSTPTPGTGIIAPNVGVLSETASYLFNIVNMDTKSSVDTGKKVYLDYIKLTCTGAPGSATNAYCVFKTNTTNRYASAGSQLTPQNVNTDVANQSRANVYFGACVTVAAAATDRQIGRAHVRTVIPVVGDVYLFKFGSLSGDQSQTIVTATAINVIIPMPPAIIGPGCWGGLALCYASGGTAAYYELEAGYYER